jgi:hypothetical protein
MAKNPVPASNAEIQRLKRNKIEPDALHKEYGDTKTEGQ